MNSKPIDFTILIDTREKLPYSYRNSRVETLMIGDYSVEGYSSEITIERKTKEDVFMSLGKERYRFQQECENMTNYKYASIVVEGTLADLLTPPFQTQMNPKAVVNSLVSWSIRYNIHVYFAGHRHFAQTLVYRILEKYVKIQKERNDR